MGMKALQNDIASGGKEQAGYLLKTEVALRLRKTTKTIERWMRQGMIPYIKIGKGKRATVLFNWDAIQSSLEEQFGNGGGAN